MHRYISPWALKRGKVIFKSLSLPLAFSGISKKLTTTTSPTPKLTKPHVCWGGSRGRLGAGQENGTHIWKEGEQLEPDKSAG